MSGSRTRKRRQLVALSAIAVMAVVIPVTAQAVTPTFNDVPVDHPFFNEINWMANTGITEGFPDGSFKPGQAVTRQAMSAFMQRLYDLQDDSSWNINGNGYDGATEAQWSDIPGATAVITVPEGVYANISARFTAESLCVGPVSEWCSVRIVTSTTGFDGVQTELYPAVGTDFAFDYGGVSGTWSAQAMERLGYGDPGTTYYVKAQAQLEGATSFFLDDMSFIAETDLQPSDYIPF